MANCNPFIWLGPGVFWLDKDDGSRIVIHPKGEPIDPYRPEAGEYSGVVRKPENLRGPGLAARMDELVGHKMARYITQVDNALEALSSIPEAQQTEADQAVTDSVETSAVLQKNAEGVATDKAAKTVTDLKPAKASKAMTAAPPAQVAADDLPGAEGAGPK